MSRLMEIARSFQFDPTTSFHQYGDGDKRDKSDKREPIPPSGGETTTSPSARPQCGPIPSMPAGVRLVEWNLKEPPVCLEVYSIVTDTTKFAHSTLGQMRRLLESPRAKVGWSMAQLIDRLRQVGVHVELEGGWNHE